MIEPVAIMTGVSNWMAVQQKRPADGSLRAFKFNVVIELFREAIPKRLFLRHADGVESSVDVMGFASAR